MNRALSDDETRIDGQWLGFDSDNVADENCNRIKWLVSEVLQEVAESPEFGAWEILYRDPKDGRYWEKVYLKGQLHGGGPPSLIAISEKDAKSKYKI